MNDNDKYDKNLRRVLGEVDDRNKPELREIWDAAGAANNTIHDQKPELNADDVELALAQVHHRLGFIPSEAAETGAAAESTANHDVFPVNPIPIRKDLGEVSRHLPVNQSSKSPRLLHYFRFVAAAIVLFAAMGTYLATVPVLYEAPLGQRMTVTLPDGSSAELNSGSKLSHSRLFGWGSRPVTVEGEVWLDVKKAATVFSVHTANARIDVTGTAFLVRYWSTEPMPTTQVFLHEGTVTFSSAENKQNTVNLIAGQQSHIKRGETTPSDPVPFVADQIFAWRKGQLAFVNTPLDAIFRELERRYDVRITHNLASIETRTLSTFYNSERSIESVLDDICTVHGLQYSRIAGGFRISSAPN